MPDPSPFTPAAFVADASEAFLLPGDLLLRGIEAVAPRAAEILAFGTGGIVVKFILALIVWTTFVVIGLLVSKACRYVARQVTALFHVLVWRIKMFVCNVKTRLIWTYRKFIPHDTAGSQHMARTDFDSTDIAVLLSIARRGPGIASSAPEISESLKLRPAQVQSRLDQLHHFKMVCPVLGSTDGFDNYSLTSAGETYLEMTRRHARKSPQLNRASAAKSY